MLSSKKINQVVMVYFGIGLTSRTQGLNLSALLLLQQMIRSFNLVQVDQAVINNPTWGEWTSWSLCTTSTMNDGVRVRSRGCLTGSCHRISGDNYEVQSCKPKETNATVQNKAFLDRCINDPAMNGTISCRLYRENPLMAYGIFKSAGEMNCDISGKPSDSRRQQRCFFQNMEDLTNFDVRNTEESLDENLPNNEILSTKENKSKNSEQSFKMSLIPQQYENERVRKPEKSEEFSIKTSNIHCADTCTAILIRATRIDEISKKTPTTAADLVNFVRNNPSYHDNSKEIKNVYNICLLNCRVNGTTKSFLQRFFNSLLKSTNLIVTKNDAKLRSSANRRIRRHARRINFNFAESLIPVVMTYKKLTKENKTTNSSNNSTSLLHKLLAFKNKKSTRNDKSKVLSNTYMSNKEHIRKRREAEPFQFSANQYESPCAERSINVLADATILNLDNTVGELFFYEGRLQPFIKTRCTGREVTQGLFQPSVNIREERNNTLAYCKQAYLKRYGFLIKYDPEGHFVFSNGDRFSVTYQPFNLESHCALTTLHR